LRKEKVELQKLREQDLQMLCRNRKASNKNQSHDIRGDEACPRFNAGPFLNSSIEPNPYPSRLQMTG
jgi:hypothetical protein